MIEKFRQSLAAILRVERRIHQFAQVLDARVSLRGVLVLQQLDVARTVDEKLQDFRGGRRAARRAKSAIVVCSAGILPAVERASRPLRIFFLLFARNLRLRAFSKSETRILSTVSEIERERIE